MLVAEEEMSCIARHNTIEVAQRTLPSAWAEIGPVPFAFRVIAAPGHVVPTGLTSQRASHVVGSQNRHYKATATNLIGFLHCPSAPSPNRFAVSC